MNNSPRENFVESEKNAITGKIKSLDDMKNFLQEHNFTKFGIEKIAQSFMAKITEEKDVKILGNVLLVGKTVYQITEGMRDFSELKNKTWALVKNDVNSRALAILEHNFPMISEHNLPVTKAKNLPAVANDNTELVAA